VLVGKPEFYRWIDAGPNTMRTLNNQGRSGVVFNLQTAMAQQVEMVSIYKVLPMRGSAQLNAKMRALGFEVFDPGMSMFTMGGGGVQCLSQAMCRDTV
jgi:N-dimethylarginine dimethylaminohydrolase